MKPVTTTHERFATDEVVRGSSDRAFGLVFATVFTVFGLLPLMSGNPIRGWCLLVAAGLIVVTVARPGLLGPFNRWWIRLGSLLHQCASPLVMGVVFYTTVTPIGLFLRITGKDVLRLRLDRDALSYWIERRPPGPAPDSMRRQF